MKKIIFVLILVALFALAFVSEVIISQALVATSSSGGQSNMFLANGVPHGVGGTCSGDVAGSFVPTCN